MLDLSAGKAAAAAGPDDALALVRAVSHAVLNDLAVVRLLLDVARDPIAAADPDTGLDAAIARVAKVGAVVQQLGLASRGGMVPEPTDVAELLRDAGDLLEVAAGTRTTLVLDVPPVPVTAVVDPGEVLQRVLTTVLTVARDVDPGTTVLVLLAVDALGPVVTVDVADGEPLRLRLG